MQSVRMHVCKLCGKKFERRQHLARHRNQVHPPKNTDGNHTCAQGSERDRKQPRRDEFPGDYWPSSQQVVVATGQAGDLLPWSSQNNLMLLAPSAVCGVLVPKNWTSSMVCGIMGISRKTLKGIRKCSGPQLEKMLEELRAVLRRYQQSPAEGRGVVAEARETDLGKGGVMNYVLF